MTNSKFEFTGEVKTLFGITLRRIKAIKAFSNVEAGEVGGWIEKETNLEVSGDAWVSGDAQVYGNARVSGDAQVYGNARVYGDARVYGNAWVYGNAQVSGDAQVYGNARVYGNAWDKSPLYIQGTKHSIVMYDSKRLKIGCQIHSIKQWLSHGERIGRMNGYTEAELEEYRLYVELAAKRYGVTESEDDENE